MSKNNNTQNVTVDLVITAHDMQDCLDECLASLTNQTYGHFRGYIIEDGSLDDTAAIAQRFAQTDERFSLFQTPGIGAAAARNFGMDKVDAPYFMLLDGDDIFHPTMLEQLVDAAVSTEADLVVCDMVQFVHDPTRAHEQRTYVAAPWSLKKSQLPDPSSADWKVHPWVNWHTIPGNLFAAFMGWPWDKLYRSAFIRKHDLRFPEDLSNSEDMLFTYEALVLADRIAVVDDALIDHRIERTGSVSSSRAREPLAFYEGLKRMRDFLQTLPSGEGNGAQNAWGALRQPFLNWAFDWTLWNIETLADPAVQAQLIKMLHDDQFALLELRAHNPAYFTGYPRTLARYASLLDDQPDLDANTGPLGALDQLPYGSFKPWCQANIVEKLAIKRRMRKNKPSEW